MVHLLLIAAVVFLLLFILGLVTFHFGAFVWVFLVVALVALLAHLVQRRR